MADPARETGVSDVVPVFVTVGIKASTGERTPGVVHMPREEAARIIAARHGVAGERMAA